MSFAEEPSAQKEGMFPEKGTYKGIRYRIDGDSVMLTASSGREVQIGPDVILWRIDEMDKFKSDVIAGTSENLELIAWRPSTYAHKPNRMVGNSLRGGTTTSEDYWNIPEVERHELENIGNEIMVTFFRSRAKQKASK